MSAMTVVVRYLALLERWEIGLDWAIGRTELVETTDAVSEGRLTDGRIGEIVIDAATPTAMALRRVTAAFGVDVADAVRSVMSELAGAPDADEIERSIHIPDLAPDRRTTSPALAGEAGAVRALPASPGEPVPVEPAIEPTLPVRGPVEVTVESHEAELIVRVRGVQHHDDLWARISDGETGALLAMTRLRPTAAGDGSVDRGGDRAARRSDPGQAVVHTSGALTFGLDRSLDELHVSVTSHPLAPVPSRVERRARWCDELLERARAVRFVRPARSRALAGEALEVADSIGDAERAAAARRAIRAARISSAAPVVALIAVIALVLWVLIPSPDPDPAPPPTTVPGTTVPPETTVPPTTDVPDTTVAPETTIAPTTTVVPTTTTTIAGGAVFGGPARYQFDPEPENDDPIIPEIDGIIGVGQVELVVFGNPLLATGDGGSLPVRVTHRFPAVYNNGATVGATEQERELSARRTCLGALSGHPTADMDARPNQPFEFLVRLLAAPDQVGGPAAGSSVIIGSVRLDEPPEVVRTDRRACQEVPIRNATLSTVAQYVRPAEDIALEIPPDIQPGLWEIELLLDDGTVARVESPITVSITP